MRAKDQKMTIWFILAFVSAFFAASGAYAVPVHIASDEETRFDTVEAGVDEESSEENSVVSQGLLDFLNSAPTYEIPPSEES